MQYLSTIEKATCHQICPWKRYLKYHSGTGTGIEPVKVQVRDLLEESVRRVIRGHYLGFAIESIHRDATEAYMSTCAKRGLAIEPWESSYHVALEQTALVQAISFGFQNYWQKAVGGTEPEVQANNYYPLSREVHPEIVMALPCDAILVRGGERHVLRIKVVSAVDDNQIYADQHSAETIALPWLLDCAATVVLYVIVGQRRRNTVGVKVQYSPWVRGYTNGMRVHWARQYTNRDGKKVTLGDTWKSFSPWIPSPECKSIEDWVGFLSSDGVIDSLMKVVTINRSSQEDWERLKLEFVYQEKQAEDIAKCLTTWKAEGTTKRRYAEYNFPMHRHSCDFPRPCEYQEVCYGSAAADPIGSLLYQPRTPTKAEATWQRQQQKSK